MTKETTASAGAETAALQMIDAEIASADERGEKWRQEHNAIMEDTRRRADEAILALIEAAAAEPVAHMLKRAATFTDTPGEEQSRVRVGRTATIRAEGLSEFRITAEATEPDQPGRCVAITTPGEPGTRGAYTAILTDALIAARRVWLDERRRRQDADDIRQRRADEDAAALTAWAPRYEIHCAALAEAMQHNGAIMLPIVQNLAATIFTARRLTYGVVYDSGADVTTETIWIAGGEQNGSVLEIEENGRIEKMTYYHPVSLGAAQSFSAIQIHAENAIDPRRFPPIRMETFDDGVNRWRVIAPPAQESIETTIRRALAEAGATLRRAPEPPAAPWVHNAQRLAETAAEIEQRHLSQDARDVIRRHLAEIEIPF